MSASLPLLPLLLVACRAEPPKGEEREVACTTEVPGDGVDQDCDGADAPAAEGTDDVDADGDGWTVGEGDCDDARDEVNPDEDERCDGLDDDCDGALPADEVDADGDGWAACRGDCNDFDGDLHPDAEELCDGLDQDCDGEEEVDGDGDGALACADCDDADASRYPGAAEACDGLDGDCDGVVPADEVDADGDGKLACATDCDDADPTVAVGHVEVCDGADDDCDGSADEDCHACDLAVPNDHAAVQDAIDAAADGDVVCVAAGTYAEELDFGGKEIAVIGVDGADATILDGSGSRYASVVSFVSGEGAGAVLRGFTVTGAAYDSGVRVVGASPTLEELVVTGNGAATGGGIYVEDGAPTLARLVVTGNDASYSSCGYDYGEGGGVALVRSDAVLMDVRVEGNAAGEDGGGLYLRESDAVLDRVSVVGNGVITGFGGGLLLSASSPVLTNVLVTGNATLDGYWHATYGAGVAVYEGAPTFVNVVVADNDAGDYGGGVYAQSAELTLVNTVVSDNRAAAGAGFYVAGATVALRYSDVWGNAPDDLVGATDPTGTDGNVSVDPAFLDAAYHLDAASPLVDAGDPAILDPDGSVSDIGLYGGPEADAWDRDGDGYAAWWRPGAYDATTSPGADCDDDDATVYPGSGC